MTSDRPAGTDHPAAPTRRIAFGARLKYLREDAGLLQAEVASRAGMDRGYYGEIENGRRSPTLDKILEIADALGVHPQLLFAGPEFAQHAEGEVDTRAAAADGR